MAIIRRIKSIIHSQRWMRCNNLVDQEQEEAYETQAPVREEPRLLSQQPCDGTPTTSVGLFIKNIALQQDDHAPTVLPVATPVRVSTPIGQRLSSRCIDWRGCTNRRCCCRCKRKDYHQWHCDGSFFLIKWRFNYEGSHTNRLATDTCRRWTQ